MLPSMQRNWTDDIHCSIPSPWSPRLSWKWHKSSGCCTVIKASWQSLENVSYRLHKRHHHMCLVKRHKHESNMSYTLNNKLLIKWELKDAHKYAVGIINTVQAREEMTTCPEQEIKRDKRVFLFCPLGDGILALKLGWGGDGTNCAAIGKPSRAADLIFNAL